MLRFTCTKKNNKEAAHMSILTQVVQESIEILRIRNAPLQNAAECLRMHS